MPSRDENGKRIPGYKQRKRKAEREAPDPPVKKPAAKKQTLAKKDPVPPATSEHSDEQEQGWFQGTSPTGTFYSERRGVLGAAARESHPVTASARCFRGGGVVK